MLMFFKSGTRSFCRQPTDFCRRPNWEFYITFRGSACPHFYGQEREQEEPKQDHMWVIPPMLHYAWSGDSPCAQRTVFHFSNIPQEFEKLVRERGFLSFPLHAHSRKCLQKIALETQEWYPNIDFRSVLVFQKVLAMLCLICMEEMNLKGSSDSILARRQMLITRAIDNFTTQLPRLAKVDEIASNISSSPSELRRVFSHSGLSPKEAFLNAQIQRAQHLAATTQLTLDEIAAQSGFCNQANLCRTFKRLRGITFHHWRVAIAYQDEIPKEKYRPSARLD